jgi:signal transduction histidine kinase
MGWIRSAQEHTRSLDIIDQEARRLGHLVDKVLCFDRVERGENTLIPEQTDLASLMREVLEAFAPLATARHVQVRVELDDDVVAEVDRGAMRQVLINLLDNAVKYGPAGQTISVGLKCADDGRWARIWVEDEGPGIPESERAKIWEPFHRLERDANSAVAGSGIGLALVRNLTVAHGGRVFAEEGASSGSRFTVEIPCAGRAFEPAPARPAVTTGAGAYTVADDQLVTRP